MHYDIVPAISKPSNVITVHFDPKNNQAAIDWLIDNCHELIYSYGFSYVDFYNQADAVRFKLIFGVTE